MGLRLDGHHHRVVDLRLDDVRSIRTRRMQPLKLLSVRLQVVLGLAVVLALAGLVITPLMGIFHDSMSKSSLFDLSSSNVKQKLARHKNIMVKRRTKMHHAYTYTFMALKPSGSCFLGRVSRLFHG